MKKQIEQHIMSQAEVMLEWQSFAPEIREKVAAIEAQRAATETRLAAAETRISQLMRRVAALEALEEAAAARPLSQIKKLFKKE